MHLVTDTTEGQACTTSLIQVNYKGAFAEGWVRVQGQLFLKTSYDVTGECGGGRG